MENIGEADDENLQINPQDPNSEKKKTIRKIVFEDKQVEGEKSIPTILVIKKISICFSLVFFKAIGQYFYSDSSKMFWNLIKFLNIFFDVLILLKKK